MGGTFNSIFTSLLIHLAVRAGEALAEEKEPARRFICFLVFRPKAGRGIKKPDDSEVRLR